MTFPVASLANIIVALISQSLISTPSYVTNMSHHPHFGYRTPDRDISPRAFNEKSPAAKSSNSNRSFPAGPLRSSLALICVATNHGYLSLSLFFKKSATLDSYTHAPCLRGRSRISNPNLIDRHLRSSNRATQLTSRFDPSREVQFERRCHPCCELLKSLRLRDSTNTNSATCNCFDKPISNASATPGDSKQRSRGTSSRNIG